MALVPAICTQCGANICIDNKNASGICPFCNATFLIEKDSSNKINIIINNTQSNTYISSEKKDDQVRYVDATYLKNYPKIYQQKVDKILSMLKYEAERMAAKELRSLHWISGKEWNSIFYIYETSTEELIKALESNGVIYRKHDQFNTHDDSIKGSENGYVSYIKKEYIDNEKMAIDVINELRIRLERDGFKNIVIESYKGKTHLVVEDDRDTGGLLRKILFGRTRVYVFENETVGLDISFSW